MQCTPVRRGLFVHRFKHLIHHEHLIIMNNSHILLVIVFYTIFGDTLTR